jgi:MinD-like ATPase involved in chromosome partitioning or flagellar assembly
MLTVVVAGLPALAGAMDRSRLFRQVIDVRSTSQLRNSVAAVKGLPKEEVVFVFADTLAADIPNVPVSQLVSRLAQSGYPVVVAALSPQGVEIVRANPQTGLLAVPPLTLNAALAAISGLSTVGTIPPHAGGYDELSLTGTGSVAHDPLTSAATTQTPAPVAAPVEAPAFRTPALSSDNPAPSFQVPSFGAKPAPAAEPVRNETPSFTAPVERAPQSAFGPSFTTPANPAAAAPSTQPAPVSAPAFERPAAATETPAFQTPAFGSSGGFGSEQQGFSGPVNRSGYQASMPKGERRGMVITVAVPKGGAGKSSLSLNLAAFLGMTLRAEGKKICIVDLNYQQADIGKYLGRFAPNVLDFVQDPRYLHEDLVLEKLVHRDDINISALLGPPNPNDGNPAWMTPKLYNDLIDLLKKHYDVILLDCPVAERFLPIMQQVALPRADFVAVPVNPNVATLLNTANWLRQAVNASAHEGGAGISLEKVGIVLNRAKDNIDCSEDDVRAALASWRFLGSIPETDEWQRANNRNEIVATYNYVELQEAFAEVLYEITGESALLAHTTGPRQSNDGVLAKLRDALRRGR